MPPKSRQNKSKKAPKQQRDAQRDVQRIPPDSDEARDEELIREDNRRVMQHFMENVENTEDSASAAPAPERDVASTVRIGQPDSDEARDEENIKKDNEKVLKQFLEGDGEEKDESNDVFIDNRQKTPAMNQDELLSIIAHPSARRVKKSQHQPLASYTPPCTRSMRPQHTRDVISPGVLNNELGYQKRWPGKYPRPQEAKEWEEFEKNKDKFAEIEKKKKEDEKRKKKEKEEEKKKKEAKKKEKSAATKKKSSSKDKKKKRAGKGKKTPSRKTMAKKGYKK